jgi:branched-chain amino acid transport system permease protein
VLVIAVIGGLYRIEGAWVGALVFVVLNNYSQQISFVGPRFGTLIGGIFLVIVLVSPGGLVGLWDRAIAFAFRRRSSSGRGSVDLGGPEPSV